MLARQLLAQPRVWLAAPLLPLHPRLRLAVAPPRLELRGHPAEGRRPASSTVMAMLARALCRARTCLDGTHAMRVGREQEGGERLPARHVTASQSDQAEGQDCAREAKLRATSVE